MSAPTASAPKKAIFAGASDEIACMRVMSNLKFKGECLDTLHEQINMNLKVIERLIVAQPDNEALRTMYLQTLTNYKKGKCVATWTQEVEVVDKKGVKTMKSHKIGVERRYNMTDWIVSLTAKKEVRVHLNDTAKAKIEEEYKGYKDFKTY
jgi:hypothetical protein